MSWAVWVLVAESVVLLAFGSYRIGQRQARNYGVASAPRIVNTHCVCDHDALNARDGGVRIPQHFGNQHGCIIGSCRCRWPEPELERATRGTS